MLRLVAGTMAQLALAAAFLALLGLRRRHPGVDRHFSGCLAVLAILAVLAHLDFFLIQGNRGPINWWEFYHYHQGTKYFGEVGYTGLYEATVLADLDDDRPHFAPRSEVRSLADYSFGTRDQVLARADAIRASFSPQRWSEFKRDLGVYREARGPRWTYRIVKDHGYNGSPLVTGILGTLANQAWFSLRPFLSVLAWGDLALMLATAALVGRLLGAESGWLLLFLWAVNPLNDYNTIGGGYLRVLYLVALALSLAYRQRGNQRASGALLAISSLLRVFPALLAAALLARDLASPDRWRRLARGRPWYLWFGGTAVVLVLTTSLVPSPPGQSPWRAFVDKMVLHQRALAVNVITLDYPFLYSRSHNVEEIRRAARAGRSMDWETEVADTLRGRWRAHALAVGAGGLVLLLTLRGASDGEAMLGGLAAVFVLSHLSHYDWAVLALVPLMLPQDRAAPAELAVLFATLAAVELVPRMAAVHDLKFLVMSLLVGTYLLWAVVGRLMRRRPVGLSPASRLSAPAR